MKSATSQRTIFSCNRNQPFAAVLAAILLASAIASAQTGTVPYSFNGTTDGKTPYGGVVLDSEGNLYRTTFEGGNTCYSLPDSCGVVFKLTPSGTQTLVHSFAGSGKPGFHDGDWPWAGLVMDKKGNLYGTTSSGGSTAGASSNAGTVFKVGPTGKETILYSFKGYADGNEPEDNLILDGEGNLYGTTFYGGTGTDCSVPDGGCGTVFEVTQAGTETVLYSFGGGASAVKNPGNFNRVSEDAINGKVWQAAEHELPRVRVSPSSPIFWKFREQVDASMDGHGDAASGRAASVLVDVIADVSEIANGSVRPANTHQPGYRSSIIFRTSV